ncbi:hypothetical protein BJ165DRAFT_1547154 [Panaeolus papilionaceus]|nr:hypothetical protein BJ165DRAFT_1547154 [Panaeolus papilionaceus]
MQSQYKQKREGAQILRPEKWDALVVHTINELEKCESTFEHSAQHVMGSQSTLRPEKQDSLAGRKHTRYDTDNLFEGNCFNLKKGGTVQHMVNAHKHIPDCIHEQWLALSVSVLENWMCMWCTLIRTGEPEQSESRKVGRTCTAQDSKQDSCMQLKDTNEWGPSCLDPRKVHKISRTRDLQLWRD